MIFILLFLEMLEFLKKILGEKESSSLLFKRNLAKEYLQVLVLSFLYSKKEYRNLAFYGGSCLRHCFNLPRLSEDLDFVDINDEVDLNNLAKDTDIFFKKKLDTKVATKIQKFRLTLKFPLLHQLRLTEPSESDFLFLKIEVYKEFGFCRDYKVEIVPVFKFGEAILIRTFDLPTLMATKTRALLSRKWEKTNREGRILARVKGRDYFDLMWYLEKGVEPNLKCLGEIKDKQELKEKLLKIVERVDAQSIKFDLEGLIEEKGFLNGFKNHIKEIMRSQLEKW